MDWHPIQGVFPPHVQCLDKAVTEEKGMNDTKSYRDLENTVLVTSLYTPTQSWVFLYRLFYIIEQYRHQHYEITYATDMDLRSKQILD